MSDQGRERVRIIRCGTRATVDGVRAVEHVQLHERNGIGTAFEHTILGGSVARARDAYAKQVLREVVGMKRGQRVDGKVGIRSVAALRLLQENGIAMTEETFPSETRQEQIDLRIGGCRRREGPNEFRKVHFR